MNPRPYTPPDTGGMQSKSRKADKPVATPDAALQPVMILVRPQLPENVGMAARAMLNCGLSQLRVVSPKFDWPNQTAFNASSGADQVLRDARKFDSVQDAIADLQIIYATSPRNHYLNLPVVMLPDCGPELIGAQLTGEKTGILFGPERAGLENEDIAHANKILTIPLQRDFNSLNLSQAVLLVGYQLFLQMSRHDPAAVSERGKAGRSDPAAPREELSNFLGRLIGLLDDGGFLYPPEKRPAMVDNLSAMFARMGLSSNEIKTLHGVVTTLIKK